MSISEPTVRSFHTRTKALGALEIIGGLSGCTALLWVYFAAVHRGTPGGDVQLALLPFAALTTAGVALLQSKRFGLWVSLVMQLAQIVSWTIGGTMWRFTAGPFLTLTLLADKTTIFAGWDISLRLSRVPENTQDLVALNLVPAVLAFSLWREWRANNVAGGVTTSSSVSR